MYNSRSTDASGGQVTAPAARPSPSQGLAAVYLALTVQTLLVAGTYLFAKRTLQEMRPEALLCGRFLLSGILFCLILWIIPGPRLPPRRSLKMVLWLGFVAGPLNQGSFMWGLARSTAAHGALLYALTPLAVYLYSLSRGRERPSHRKTIGITVALLGVLVLLLGRGLRAATGPLVGDLFILAAMVAWAVYTSEGQALATEHGAIRATAWTMIAASLFVLPMLPFSLSLEQVEQLSGVALGGLIYLGVLTPVVSYLLWYFALSRIDASRAAIFANLQPVATALAAWWLFGDRLHWEFFVGGGLVLLGLRITQTG